MRARDYVRLFGYSRWCASPATGAPDGCAGGLRRLHDWRYVCGATYVPYGMVRQRATWRRGPLGTPVRLALLRSNATNIPLDPSPEILVNLSDYRRFGKLVVKLLIFVLVSAGIFHSLSKAEVELRGRKFPWDQVQWEWLGVACCIYALSMIPMAWFWRRLLLQMNQKVGRYETFRAYTIGHLGKYVPGKVMVVILRAGLIHSRTVDPVVATVTIFVETLTMMSNGAFLAAVTLFLFAREQHVLQLLAVGLMVSTLVVTLPPILKMIVRKLKANEPPERLNALLDTIQWQSIAQGWLAGCVTWSLVTLSLWATLRALPHHATLSLDLVSFVHLLSSVTLAVVAGFLSLLPGGIGVREWVLNETMVPMFGETIAIISTITLRLLWLLTELSVSAILFLVPPRGAARLSQPGD